MAVPPLSAAKPSEVDPSKNSTDPGGVPLPAVTLAVNVTDWPNTDGFGDTTNVVTGRRLDREAKDHTAAVRSADSRAVKAAVVRLDQTRLWIRAFAVVEAVERRQRAGRIDLEDGAVRLRAASNVVP